MARIHRLLKCIILLLFSCQQSIAQHASTKAERVELFCGATLGYADNNWLRLYDVQINATPGVRWHLGNDWSVAAQGLIPIVSVGNTYKEAINKYWRANIIAVSRQLHFNRSNQHFKLTAGLFDNQRYGVDVKWAWPVNEWLLLNAQTGLTASWIMGTDFKGHYDADFYGDKRLTYMAGADVFLRQHNIESRLSVGKYTGGDYGSQFEIMRHFSHCTLLAYAQLRLGKLTKDVYDDKTYRTNGGFKIIWMLPPYKKNSSRSVEIRPATNFRLTHSARGNTNSMQSYSVDPEENEREHQVEVSWGLRKEATP